MNYVVKVVNGQPVIYGSAGYEGAAPVYIFQTKAAYDAAITAKSIPVGALIVKTYDANELGSS